MLELARPLFAFARVHKIKDLAYLVSQERHAKRIAPTAATRPHAVPGAQIHWSAYGHAAGEYLASFKAHKDATGARERRSACIGLHLLLGVSPEWVQEFGDLHDPENPRILRLFETAKTFAEEFIGGVWAVRIDLDERGGGVVDVFASPVHERRAKLRKDGTRGSGVIEISVRDALQGLQMRAKGGRSYAAMQTLWSAHCCSSLDARMVRGVPYRITGRKHLSVPEFREAAEAAKAHEIKREGDLATLANTIAYCADEQQRIRRRDDHIAAHEGLLQAAALRVAKAEDDLRRREDEADRRLSAADAAMAANASFLTEAKRLWSEADVRSAEATAREAAASAAWSEIEEADRRRRQEDEQTVLHRAALMLQVERAEAMLADRQAALDARAATIEADKGRMRELARLTHDHALEVQRGEERVRQAETAAALLQGELARWQAEVAEQADSVATREGAAAEAEADQGRRGDELDRRIALFALDKFSQETDLNVAWSRVAQSTAMAEQAYEVEMDRIAEERNRFAAERSEVTRSLADQERALDERRNDDASRHAALRAGEAMLASARDDVADDRLEIAAERKRVALEREQGLAEARLERAALDEDRDRLNRKAAAAATELEGLRDREEALHVAERRLAQDRDRIAEQVAEVEARERGAARNFERAREALCEADVRCFDLNIEAIELRHRSDRLKSSEEVVAGREREMEVERRSLVDGMQRITDGHIREAGDIEASDASPRVRTLLHRVWRAIRTQVDAAERMAVEARNSAADALARVEKRETAARDAGVRAKAHAVELAAREAELVAREREHGRIVEAHRIWRDAFTSGLRDMAAGTLTSLEVMNSRADLVPARKALAIIFNTIQSRVDALATEAKRSIAIAKSARETLRAFGDLERTLSTYLAALPAPVRVAFDAYRLRRAAWSERAEQGRGRR